MTEIKHKITSSVLWKDDLPTVRDSLVAAVKARANLYGANLSRADLSGADLSRADLSRADLFGAYLSGAYLSGANLSRADLSRADLSKADLYGANLSRADLSRANLSRADLSRADLSRANLFGADLFGAYLFGAYLSGAKNFPAFAVYPEAGSFTAFKKVRAPGGKGAVLRLRIDADVPRVNAIGSRKGRAERVFVEKVVSGEEAPHYVSFTDSDSSRGVRYVVGEYTVAHEYCDDVRLECAPGIHFFLTRQEAEEWT